MSQRFYFQIPSANVIECIKAESLFDAKAQAAVEWMPFWNEIEWLIPAPNDDLQPHE